MVCIGRKVVVVVVVVDTKFLMCFFLKKLCTFFLELGWVGF
jgi:hypothetical protein